MFTQRILRGYMQQEVEKCVKIIYNRKIHPDKKSKTRIYLNQELFRMSKFKLNNRRFLVTFCDNLFLFHYS